MPYWEMCTATLTAGRIVVFNKAPKNMCVYNRPCETSMYFCRTLVIRGRVLEISYYIPSTGPSSRHRTEVRARERERGRKEDTGRERERKSEVDR